MQTHCNFCGVDTTTLRTCPYEGLCFNDLNGKPITTVPKLGYVGTPRQKPEKPPKEKKAPPPKPPMKGANKRRKILCYDLYGQLLGTYKSINEAARETGFFVSAIRQCVLGLLKNPVLLGGAIFRFDNVEKTQMVRYISHYHNGVEVGRYASAADAARAINDGQCLKKKQHKIGRFVVGIHKNKKKEPDTYKANYLFI